MAEIGWLLMIGGSPVGPLGQAEVRQRLVAGEITIDTPAWRQGFREWLPLKNLSDFKDLVAVAQMTMLETELPAALQAAIAAGEIVLGGAAPPPVKKTPINTRSTDKVPVPPPPRAVPAPPPPPRPTQARVAPHPPPPPSRPVGPAHPTMAASAPAVRRVTASHAIPPAPAAPPQRPFPPPAPPAPPPRAAAPSAPTMAIVQPKPAPAAPVPERAPLLFSAPTAMLDAPAPRPPAPIAAPPAPAPAPAPFLSGAPTAMLDAPVLDAPVRPNRTTDRVAPIEVAKLVRHITAQTRAPELGSSRGIGSILGAAGISLVVGLAIAGGIFYWMTRQRAHEAEREAAVQAAMTAAEHQRLEGEDRRKRSEVATHLQLAAKGLGETAEATEEQRLWAYRRLREALKKAAAAKADTEAAPYQKAVSRVEAISSALDALDAGAPATDEARARSRHEAMRRDLTGERDRALELLARSYAPSTPAASPTPAAPAKPAAAVAVAPPKPAAPRRVVSDEPEGELRGPSALAAPAPPKKRKPKVEKEAEEEDQGFQLLTD